MAVKAGVENRGVAIFGGSFNPPHIGHSEIVKWLLTKGLADEVLIVPCFLHPFGKELAPYEHRLAMARLAFERPGLPVSVSEVEGQLGGESRTLRTVEHLIGLNPDSRFSLVAGGDVEAEIDKWHRFDELKALVDLIKIPRGPGSPIADVSSTQIRERIASGDPGWRDMVESEVAVYIVTKALYCE
ncbi:MAG: nicotinate-nicotinamide nucleotide adenylyltransferase [Proteobacteria bacterium]|nr:nicotinate-nicotinamide nucleotide adenylyltransferase [Pseudomonadota bacterium]